MNEKQKVKLDEISVMLDATVSAYYKEIRPGNEYSKVCEVWDKGYECCLSALDSVKELSNRKVWK